MRDDKTVSKSIRFPKTLLERLDRAAKEKGISFSAMVIDMLEHGLVVVIPEGREIAAKLFEIDQLLREGYVAEGNEIKAATENLTDCVEAIRERYSERG